jgi:hypothetical protein
MDSNFIPDDVAEFIIEKIDSVAHMEALLLLRRNPKERWSIPALSERLYASKNQAAELLARLCSQGIAATDAADRSLYQYRPSSPDLRQMLDRVADVYEKHLVPVTNLIHSRPRVRVQEFADAFKFRKDD